jgi:hypothetical protein
VRIPLIFRVDCGDQRHDSGAVPGTHQARHADAARGGQDSPQHVRAVPLQRRHCGAARLLRGHLPGCHPPSGPMSAPPYIFCLPLVCSALLFHIASDIFFKTRLVEHTDSSRFFNCSSAVYKNKGGQNVDCRTACSSLDSLPPRTGLTRCLILLPINALRPSRFAP